MFALPASLGLARSTSHVFTPASLPGLQLWLDGADAGSIAIGSGVSQWSDKSGYGRHATQPTGANQPAYDAGDNSLAFSAASHSFLGLDLSFLANSDYSILVAVKRVTGATGWFLGNDGPGDVNKILILGFNNDTSFIFSQYGNDLVPAISGFSSPVWEQYAGHLDSGSGHSITQNGSVLASNSNTSPLLAGSLASGTIGRSLGILDFTGAIGEVIACTPSLGTSDRATATDYLRSKWGTA